MAGAHRLGGAGIHRGPGFCLARSGEHGPRQSVVRQTQSVDLARGDDTGCIRPFASIPFAPDPHGRFSDAGNTPYRHPILAGRGFIGCHATFPKRGLAVVLPVCRAAHGTIRGKGIPGYGDRFGRRPDPFAFFAVVHNGDPDALFAAPGATSGFVHGPTGGILRPEGPVTTL